MVPVIAIVAVLRGSVRANEVLTVVLATMMQMGIIMAMVVVVMIKATMLDLLHDGGKVHRVRK